MAVGRATKLKADDRLRIEAAVEAAEKACGLQLLVYLGRAKGDPRDAAVALLQAQGYATVPGVLIFVSPKQRRVELVTSEAAKQRLPDDASSRVVSIMVPAFRNGDWVTGLELGIAAIAEEAGPGTESGEELPDVLE